MGVLNETSEVARVSDGESEGEWLPLRHKLGSRNSSLGSVAATEVTATQTRDKLTTTDGKGKCHFVLVNFVSVP